MAANLSKVACTTSRVDGRHRASCGVVPEVPFFRCWGDRIPHASLRWAGTPARILSPAWIESWWSSKQDPTSNKKNRRLGTVRRQVFLTFHDMAMSKISIQCYVEYSITCSTLHLYALQRKDDCSMVKWNRGDLSDQSLTKWLSRRGYNNDIVWTMTAR